VTETSKGVVNIATSRKMEKSHFVPRERGRLGDEFLLLLIEKRGTGLG